MDERIAKAIGYLARHPENVVEVYSGPGERVWRVRSSSGRGHYDVTLRGTTDWHCTCPFFTTREEPCQHVFQVYKRLMPDWVPTPNTDPGKARRTRRRTDPGGDSALRMEKRFLPTLLWDLLSTAVPELDTEERGRGRPSIPTREKLLCVMIRVLEKGSCRYSEGLIDEAFRNGYLSKRWNWKVTSHGLTDPGLTPILFRLVSESAYPLQALEFGGTATVDSTGLRMTSFDGWLGKMHGDTRQHAWEKLHALTGYKTHAFFRVVLTGENEGDAPQFGPLLRGAIADGLRPANVIGDKGYTSRQNYTIAEALGVEGLFPFKVNSTPTPKGSPAWARAYYAFLANPIEFGKTYRLRVSVEQTFSALKRRFDVPIRSLNPVAQVNEGLCRIVLFNIMMVIRWMFEAGIDPSFMRTSGSPTGPVASDQPSSEPSSEVESSQAEPSPNSEDRPANADPDPI